MSEKSKTYWAGNGKYQKAVDALQVLIPDEGSVKNVSKNPCLERLRKLLNAYYRIYNDGDDLHPKQKKVLGISLNLRPKNPTFHEYVEVGMDRIVAEAAKEQGIPLE